jgi:diguanylate cyclase (GGDEF)-like protein/PAS domain S-box-containing protein
VFSVAPIGLRPPKWSARRGQWLLVAAGLAVVAAMVVVAEMAREESDRHLRAQVLIERVRTSSQQLNTITWEALAKSWASRSQRLRLTPETVTQAYGAWGELNRSLKELRSLGPNDATEPLGRDAAAVYNSGVGALAIADTDLAAAQVSAQRRFRPALARLNSDATSASMQQREVAERSSHHATIAFVGSLGLGLLALGLIAFRLQRLRRQAVLADQLRALERRSEDRLRALVEHSNDVVTVVDRELVVRWQAASMQRMLGHDPAALIGRRLTTIVHPDDAELLERCVLGSVQRSGSARVSVRFGHADGAWCHVETVAEDRLHDPAVEGIILNMRDVSERKALEDELRHQAFHDALTGLANRELFEDRLSHGLAKARRNDHSLAVVFLDLDDFKTINDSLGHARGDELLRAVALRIQETLRPADTAARIGGDEFAVLVELGDNDEAAQLVADRILEALAPSFNIAGRDLRVTASVGVAYSGGGHGVEDLVRNADTAMYAAKEEGKSSVRTFEQGMHRRAVERLELSAALGPALDEQQFELEYQPIVELANGRTVGVEALVRWQHPQRKRLAPRHFIELAEETGTIVPLGLWILETACDRIRRLQVEIPRYERLALSVNLSIRQLLEPDFPQAVSEVLNRTGLSADNLTLEITEGLLRGGHEAILSQLEGVKALGLRIAVDDFGTGYSSLSHLRRFPIDILKIDRSFVDGIGQDVGKAELVRGIINLGESLHLQVIVEGIEDSQQADQLRNMGVDLGQGFLFSHPCPTDELRELLLRGTFSGGKTPL